MGYAEFERLCKEKGVKPFTVSKETGVSTATLSSWKKGKYTPKNDKLQILADYFNVPLEALTNDDFDAEAHAKRYEEYLQKDVSTGETYYIDPDAARYAQLIFEDNDLRALFHAVQGIRKEDMKLMVNMAKRFKETNPDG